MSLMPIRPILSEYDIGDLNVNVNVKWGMCDMNGLTRLFVLITCQDVTF